MLLVEQVLLLKMALYYYFLYFIHEIVCTFISKREFLYFICENRGPYIIYESGEFSIFHMKAGTLKSRTFYILYMKGELLYFFYESGRISVFHI